MQDLTPEPLVPDARHRFELVGLAEAQLRHPTGYPRELRRILKELARDERPLNLFHAFRGNIGGSTGLVAITDRRLLFAYRGLFRRRPLSIPFDDIQRAYVIQKGPNVDLKVQDERGTLGFWGDWGGRGQFPRLIEVLRHRIGDRFVADNPERD